MPVSVAAAAVSGAVIGGAILFYVGTTATIAGWKWIDQSTTIWRVALNSANEQEIQLFQHGIKDDLAFRQLTFQYQKLFSSCCCPGGPNSTFKLAGARLRIALRRVVELGMPLLPFGPPLLSGDQNPRAVHTPLGRRDPWEQEVLLSHDEFQSNPMVQELRARCNMAEYFAAVQATQDAQISQATQALNVVRAGRPAPAAAHAFQVLQGLLAGRPPSAGPPETEAARALQTLQSIGAPRSGDVAPSANGSSTSTRPRATGEDDELALTLTRATRQSGDGRASEVSHAPGRVRGPGVPNRMGSSGRAAESRPAPAGGFLSRPNTQSAGSGSGISGTDPGSRSDARPAALRRRNPAEVEMVTMGQLNPVEIASDWVPPPGHFPTSPSEAGSSSADLHDTVSASASEVASQARSFGMSPSSSNPTGRSQLATIVSASENVARRRPSGPGFDGLSGSGRSSGRDSAANVPGSGRSQGAGSDPSKKPGQNQPSPLSSVSGGPSQARGSQAQAPQERQTRTGDPESLRVRTGGRKTPIAEQPHEERSNQSSVAPVSVGVSHDSLHRSHGRAILNFAAQRAQAELEAKRRLEAHATGSLYSRQATSSPSQSGSSDSSPRESLPSQRETLSQGGRSRQGGSEKEVANQWSQGGRSQGGGSQGGGSQGGGSQGGGSQGDGSQYGGSQGGGSEGSGSPGGRSQGGSSQNGGSHRLRIPAGVGSRGGDGSPRSIESHGSYGSQGGGDSQGGGSSQNTGSHKGRPGDGHGRDGRQGELRAIAGSPSASLRASPHGSRDSSPSSSKSGSPRSTRGAPSGAVAAQVRVQEEAAQASQRSGSPLRGVSPTDSPTGSPIQTPPRRTALPVRPTTDKSAKSGKKPDIWRF